MACKRPRVENRCIRIPRISGTTLLGITRAELCFGLWGALAMVKQHGNERSAGGKRRRRKCTPLANLEGAVRTGTLYSVNILQAYPQQDFVKKYFLNEEVTSRFSGPAFPACACALQSLCDGNRGRGWTLRTLASSLEVRQLSVQEWLHAECTLWKILCTNAYFRARQTYCDRDLL